jgi:hypothetical protein
MECWRRMTENTKNISEEEDTYGVMEKNDREY